jgi:hypothetical protein
VPDATEIAGDGAHIYPYILVRYSSEGTGNPLHALKDEEGIARHSGQQELAVSDYEEHFVSHPSDGRSE